MSKTAPEITSEAVKIAEKHDEIVVSADNHHEWMYVEYSSPEDKETVEKHFPNRLVRSRRNDLGEKIDELDVPDNYQTYYLEPTV